jgi:hypothetical protein
MTTESAASSTADPGVRFSGLRGYNLAAAAVHAAQAALVLFLANDFTLPVTGTYLAGPPGTAPADPVVLFDTPVGLGVALFLALSALAHLVVASPVFFPRYRSGLLAGHNYFRWVEYSLSASLMIVLIAQLTGISDVAALLALFGVNAGMIFFGWVQEKYEQPGGGGWLPFVFGCILGLVPWLAVLVVFAVNQWLQYRRVGRWADYLVGERTYITLSLIAKSALAWQVFGGTLAS